MLECHLINIEGVNNGKAHTLGYRFFTDNNMSIRVE